MKIFWKKMKDFISGILVLQSYIIAHKEYLVIHKILQKKVSLSRLHHSCMPVHINCCRIYKRKLQGESAKRIHFCIECLLLAGKDVIKAYLKLPSCIPLLRHILKPANNCNAVAIGKIVIYKILAVVFLRIVGQTFCYNRAAHNRLSAVDGEGANAFLQLSYLNSLAVGRLYCIAAFLLGSALDVPNLAVEN